MIEGVLRHCTEMAVEKTLRRQPRPERGRVRLLPPARLPAPAAAQGHSRAEALPPGGRQARALSAPCSRSSRRPINWDLIRQQYDEMVKYATALRLGTAETEAILRRFTREQPQAPDLPGAGRAGQGDQDDLPVPVSALRGAAARDPRRAERRRELEQRQRLHLLRQGRRDRDATAWRTRRSRSCCLHLLQICLVYVNTLMIQHVLGGPRVARPHDRGGLPGLTPLIYAHVNPYGRFELDMETRLPLDEPAGLVA